MFEINRFGKVYRDGVKEFIQYASTYGPWKTLCPCPCSRCLNGGRLDIKEVQQHLYEYGIDKSYITWVFHGEKHPVNTVMNRPVESVSNEQVREDVFPDLTPFIDAAFEFHGRNGGGVFTDDSNGTHDDNEEPFEFEPDAQKRHGKYKVNPSSVKKYEQVKAARARRQELIDAGLVSALDFENDEIAEVFGPDKCRAGLLGYSPLVSKKQALYASVATAVMFANTNPTSNAPRTDHMVEALLPKHTELITNIVLQVMAKPQQNQHSASTNPGTGGGVEDPNGNQLVLLYNRKREIVATGHVVYGIDGEHCEGLLVHPEERKVCLETIEDGKCVVPDSPQGDRCYLEEYVANESVICPVSRMEFV